MLLFLLLHQAVIWIDWVIFDLIYILNLILLLIFAMYFIWRPTLCCTEPFSKIVYCFHEAFLFLGSNRQHMSVCAKTSSFGGRKIFSMPVTHMSVGTLQGAAASAALVAGVSLVAFLLTGDWARVPTPARHYFQYISLVQIRTRNLCSMQSWALVSSHFFFIKVKHWVMWSLVDMLACWAIALPSAEQIVSQLSMEY